MFEQPSRYTRRSTATVAGKRCKGIGFYSTRAGGGTTATA